MNVAIDDPTITSALKTELKPGERWAYGPICFAGERKAYVTRLDTYTGWVGEVDDRFKNSNASAQRIRMLYYGRATNVLPLFDSLLNSDPSWVDQPLTRDDISAAALDGLIGTGWIRVAEVDGGPSHYVDPSHVWILLDRALNGQTWLAGEIDAVDSAVGLFSWTGDLASWWTEYNDHKLCDRKQALDNNQTWTESPSDPRPATWLKEGQATRCALDDIFGDMDAIVLSNEAMLEINGGMPLGAVISTYYDPTFVTDPADKRALRVINRFHLFVKHALPASAWTEGSGGFITLTSTAKDSIRTIIAGATRTLLLNARGVGPGLLKKVSWKHPLDAAVTLATTYLAIAKTVDDDLGSPWGAPTLNQVADTFWEFLSAGLAGNGWTSGAWPSVDFDFNSTRRGGFALQLGDSDSKSIYGGIARTPGTTTYVQDLKADLLKLGFTGVGDSSGEFTQQTAMTLREFQIEASQDNIYATYAFGAPKSGQVLLPAIRRYRGPINGVADLETAQALHTWLITDQPLKHCLDKGGPGRFLDYISNPMTFQSRGGNAQSPGSAIKSDLWWYNAETRADTGSTTYPLVFATDQIQRYPIPDGDLINSNPQLACVGRYYNPDGPLLGASASWNSELITPDNLVPLPLDPMDPAVHSRYRVVRAVAEVECLGKFDIVNAWDSARLSFGLFHWALKDATGVGELGALLAYYKSIEPDGYERDFGRFGIEPEKPWDPAAFGAEVPAKYVAHLAMYGLTDSTGVIQAGQLLPLLPGSNDDYLTDWLRSWRNIHRVAMVLRTGQSFRRAQWQFASMRLTDLLGLTWPAGNGVDVPLVTIGTTQQVALVGQVFTSERAVAALIRWHVNSPDTLLPPKSSNLQKAYVGAFGTGAVDVSVGTPDQKKQLQEGVITQLLSLAGTTLSDSINQALAYGDSIGDPLLADAGSYIGQ